MTTPPAPQVDPLAAVAALPGVPEAVDEARRAVDGLLGHRVLRRRSAEVTAESALRGARASAELEGVGVELERLRGRLLEGATDLPGRPAADAALVTGAVRLHAELGSQLSTWRAAPLQALARLHVLAARDLPGVEEATLGRPRLAGESAADPLGLGPAPGPAEVSARLSGLAEVLTLPTAAPALVVAAVVHGELLALRPFGLAGGLVARAAARLVLVARGLDPKAVSVPEVGHVELSHPHGPGGPGGRSYAEAARAYAGGGADGVAVWVRHCCDAAALGAREGLAVCEAVLRADA